MGGGSYNFQRPDRRLISRQPCIYAPSRSGFGADHVVVAVDTSGSIGKQEVNMFFAEMSGVLEDVHPANLWVMWCDAYVHRVDRVEDTSDLQAMYEAGVPGRGGTSFVPVFEKDQGDEHQARCAPVPDGRLWHVPQRPWVPRAVGLHCTHPGGLSVWRSGDDPSGGELIMGGGPDWAVVASQIKIAHEVAIRHRLRNAYS
jgi:hypothetical protein